MSNLNPQPAKQAAAKAFNTFNLASFTIGTEAADTINVAIQLKDARGQAVRQFANVKAFLSASADGHTLTPTVTTSALAIGTNGVLLNIPVTGKMVDLLTDSSGRADINVIQTAVVTYYLVVVLPDGSIVVSGAIAFA